MIDQSIPENRVATQILACCYDIHRELGPGLYESVYERVLCYELRRGGLTVERQKPIPVVWKGHSIDEAFKADLIVEGLVLLELKSVEEFSRLHKKQVATYLKLTGLRLGYLLNFGHEVMKTGVTRVANGLPD